MTKEEVQRGQLPYVQVRVEVMRDPTLKGPAKALYAVLCTYANFTDRSCWPSRKLLAADMGMSLAQLDRWVLVLIEAGLLDRKVRSRTKEERLTNLWTLLDVDWRPSGRNA